MATVLRFRTVLLCCTVVALALAVAWPASATIVQLTSDPTYDSGWASMSADGSKIAFASHADFTGGNSDHSDEIFVINFDGTGLRQLTNTPSGRLTCLPAISGDGSKVAFFSDADLDPAPGGLGNSDLTKEIFVINSDGTGLLQLTSSGAFYTCDLAISANGAKVTFMSEGDLAGSNSDGSGEVFVINTDGTGLTQLTDWGNTSYDSGEASPSADGSVVVFGSDADLTGGNSDHSHEIFMIDSDGSNLRQLTSDGSYDSGYPSMTADASVVVFASAADLDPAPGGPGNSDYSLEAFVMNSDGTGVRQLTNDPYDLGESGGVISGDGSVIVLGSHSDLTGGNSDLSWEVFVINPDGTGLRQLTSDPSYGSGGFPNFDGSVVLLESQADHTGNNSDHNSEVFLTTAANWQATDQDLPQSLAWDESADVSVEATNDGNTNWGSGYALVSVEGPTSSAVAIDRWGLQYLPISGVTVAPTASYLFDFTINAPPITSLQYTAPVGPTAPGLAGTFDCNWLLASPYTPTPFFITSDLAEADVAVGRFPDVTPSVVGWYWIEQLAGRVPLVVKGYPNGTYGPTVTVDRQQMAIFMARALNLPLLAHEGTFTDVPDTLVGWEHIEALARADIVSGFSATIYGPAGIVTREQMAIFVARGMAGGDSNVPSGPAVASFPDVATGAVSYKYVEYCVAAEVVGGYPNGTYGPTLSVTREQMAIFVWRGFMVSTGVPVVIGGPAATGVEPDPAVAGYLGWSSEQLDPSWAYVALDALRIDTNLAAGGTWDIFLEVRDAATPTGAPVAWTGVSLTPGEISTILNAAVLSGDPYLIVKWDLSAEGLAAGDYILVAEVEDSAGNWPEVGWKRAAATYAGRFFPFTVS